MNMEKPIQYVQDKYKSSKKGQVSHPINQEHMADTPFSNLSLKSKV